VAPELANGGRGAAKAPSSSAVGARIEATKAPRVWGVGRGVPSSLDYGSMEGHNLSPEKNR